MNRLIITIGLISFLIIIGYNVYNAGKKIVTSYNDKLENVLLIMDVK